MNEQNHITWDGPRAIVPAEALKALELFKQEFDYVPLGHCRDCGGCNGTGDDSSCEWLSDEPFGVYPEDWCSSFHKRQYPCRNTDEKPESITEEYRDWVAAQAAKVRAQYGRKL